MKAIYFQVSHVCHSVPAVAAGYSYRSPTEVKTHYWPQHIFFDHHCLAMLVCVCERGCGSDPAVISLLAKGVSTLQSRPLQVLLLTDRTIWR